MSNDKDPGLGEKHEAACCLLLGFPGGRLVVFTRFKWIGEAKSGYSSWFSVFFFFFVNGGDLMPRCGSGSLQIR